jgi:hypothetical protein
MGARSAQRSAAAAQDQDQAPPDPAPAYEPAAQEPDAPEAAAPESAESEQVQQIRQLAALRDQGILTEEEFAASKAKILGI